MIATYVTVFLSRDAIGIFGRTPSLCGNASFTLAHLVSVAPVLPVLIMSLQSF